MNGNYNKPKPANIGDRKSVSLKDGDQWKNLGSFQETEVSYKLGLVIDDILPYLQRAKANGEKWLNLSVSKKTFAKKAPELNDEIRY